jgi:hypothetical protein
VVDVSSEVESEILLQAVNVGKVAALPRFFKPGEGVICAINVGLVVLGVVKFHNPSTDVGLKSGIVIGQVGQYVGRHSVLLQSCAVRSV